MQIQNTTDSTPRLLLLALVILGALAASRSPMVWAKTSQWTPIDTSTGQVRIRSSIGGVDGYSMIDSGANLNAINTEFLEQNNLSFKRSGKNTRVGGVVSEDSKRTYTTMDVTLFDTNMKVRSLIGIDLGDPDLQLLLGEGFLSHFIFQFDYPQQRMRLLTRDTLDMKKVSNVKSKRDAGGSPIVKVRLNDELNVWLLLDTGSSGGILLDRKVVNRTSWLKDYNAVSGSILGVNDAGAIDKFALPNVRFGPYDIGNVNLRTPAKGSDFEIFKRAKFVGTHIPVKSGQSSGIIGYEVLKHFVVTLDYKSGRVHISPGARK